MAEKLTDIELESVRLLEIRDRALSKSSASSNYQEDDVRTALGPIHVVVHGDRSKPAIVTYHDIGLNSASCFQGFFNFPEMQAIMKHFCVYHINAPGQQEGAPALPMGLGFTDPAKTANYEYPTMDQLASMILPVLEDYNIKDFIGFGVGAGANILSRFALLYPDKVSGLVLVNPSASQAGWTEWGYQKWNTWYLKSGQMTYGIEEYLLWHWFGKVTMAENHDLVTVYLEYLKAINPVNLGFFIDAYVKRTDLGIVRAIDQSQKDLVKNFKCKVMLVTGQSSPHLDDTVWMNGRLDPTISDWVKFDCGAMVLEEAPAKLSESFLLFLQGMGYVAHVRHKPVDSVCPNAATMSKAEFLPPSKPSGDSTNVLQATATC